MVDIQQLARIPRDAANLTSPVVNGDTRMTNDIHVHLGGGLLIVLQLALLVLYYGFHIDLPWWLLGAPILLFAFLAIILIIILIVAVVLG